MKPIQKQKDYTIIREAGITQMLKQFKLIRQLNPNLKLEAFKKMILEMAKLNYKMLCIYEGKKCVAVSGYWIGVKMYCGKYLELDNVVVDESYRSKGLGKLLCDELLKIGIEHNCKVLMLDAYLSNESAHKFYEREGYVKKGYHFIKKVGK